jgi:hypothetical protein
MPTDGGSALPLIFRALYDAAGTVTGFVGLTPLQVIYVAAVLVGTLVMYNLVRSITGRSSWTLDERETPAGYVIVPTVIRPALVEDDEL